jgi:hypothetical protein
LECQGYLDAALKAATNLKIPAPAPVIAGACEHIGGVRTRNCGHVHVSLSR